MKFAKVIRKAIAHDSDGVSVRGGINAAVAANVNEPGTSRTSVRSESHIVQDSRSARTSHDESPRTEQADG